MKVQKLAGAPTLDPTTVKKKVRRYLVSLHHPQVVQELEQTRIAKNPCVYTMPMRHSECSHLVLLALPTFPLWPLDAVRLILALFCCPKAGAEMSLLSLMLT